MDKMISWQLLLFKFDSCLWSFKVSRHFRKLLEQYERICFQWNNIFRARQEMYDHQSSTRFLLWSPPCSFFNEKTFKTFSGTRKTSSNQNSHSLQRNSTHKHGTGNGNRNPETARSGKHTANKETGGGKVNKGGKTRGQGHHSSHVSEVSQGLHVSGAPEVTGPRGHHSHDAHYFVDYWEKSSIFL